MRLITLSMLLLAACSKTQPTPPDATQLFAGEGRNALCLSGPAEQQRGGFIVYGGGDSNCSAQGRIERAGAGFALIPSGEGACRIAFTITADRLLLGPVEPSCAYYCGPGAGFGGARFGRVTSSDATAAANNPMTDFAGEPLC